MKAITLFVCLLFAGPAFGQMPATTLTKAELAAGALADGGELAEPFKGANVVVLHTADSAALAIRGVAKILQEQGFPIDRLDYDLLSVSTKPRQFMQTGAYTMTVLAVWSPAGISLTGVWKTQALSITVEDRAAFTNPASKKAFAELQLVALAYPAGQVKYKARR